MQDEYGNEITLPSPYRSLNDVIRANERANNHWFEPDTMRFFRTRLCGDLIAGRFFVTSEKNTGWGYNYPRLYSVRVAHDDGTIGTVGSFQQFRSRNGALNAAYRFGRELQKATA